jgi:hypothetical protein
MLTLKTGQFATLQVDPAGVALLKGVKLDFRSSDERVCAVKPDGTGYGCTVYAMDGGVDMQAQVLVMSGGDVISSEDVEVIAQDKPPVVVNLLVGAAVDAP